MLSVNTNTGAMVALQYLNQTNAQLAQTENEVNTGMKVASAKDNGATFAIAQDMRGDVAGYSAVTDSLNRATSSVDVAMSRRPVDLGSADPDEAAGAVGVRPVARHAEPPGDERRLHRRCATRSHPSSRMRSSTAST